MHLTVYDETKKGLRHDETKKGLRLTYIQS